MKVPYLFTVGKYPPPPPLTPSRGWVSAKAI
jgi:hypothetical protein